MNAVPPPAGWYPDPSGRAPFRYWDGARWTEHTDQGRPAPGATAPAQVPAPPAPAPAPQYAPAAPMYGQTVPQAAPAAAAATPKWDAQTFVADVKKLDGLALVVVGALVFLIFSFFNWASVKVSGVDQNGNPASEESSSNAWDGDVSWLILGYDVQDLRTTPQGQLPDSNTDMIILLPVAVIAAGAAAASRLGKRITRVNEIVLGASAVLAVLMIAEVVHIGGAVDDYRNLLAAQGIGVSGGAAFGMYLSTAGAVLMTAGAAKNFMASKHPSGS